MPRHDNKDDDDKVTHTVLYYRLPATITAEISTLVAGRTVLALTNGNRGTILVARNRYTLSILLWQINAIKTDNLIMLKRKLNFHRQAIRTNAFVFININIFLWFLIGEHGIYQC